MCRTIWRSLGGSSNAVRALPQGLLIRQLNPKIQGWANYYRTGVSQAVYDRLDHLTWIKLRSWARWRHPRKSIGWVTPALLASVGRPPDLCHLSDPPDAVSLRAHSEVRITRHVNVQGNRSPYDGDWVYWSTRQGRHPMTSSKLARLLKEQRGRCRYCGLFFQHDDRIEVDHINGNHRDSRSANLQALHGHCHNAKTRKQANTSRQVCVTSIKTLRSGVTGNDHAPVRHEAPYYSGITHPRQRRVNLHRRAGGPSPRSSDAL